MIKAKKHLGQHFLVDKNIAKKISDSLLNEHNFPVLEIGPGTGVLTVDLVKRNFDLSLIEIDLESVEYLKANFDNQFRLIHGDFLKIKLDEIYDNQFCIIGNFPYNISSQIFFKMMENKERIPELVCMIQKEVAERMASPHGNKTYGIMSVFVQLYYKIEYLFTVNENVFVPPPKVKSGVIRLTRYRESLDGVDERKLFQVIKMAFNQRRKTIRNSVKGMLTENTDMTHRFFALRSEQLCPEDFIELTNLLS